jgi:hypothetical protein
MQRLQPALLGGLFIGVLSSLPLVRYGNACCCLWVVAGGLVTVYLQRQNPPAPNSSAAFEAVLGGVIAGMVGAVIELVLAALLGGHPSAGEMQQIMDQFPQIPLEMRERVVQTVDERGSMFLAALSLVFIMPVYAIFSVAGALLGLALFKKPAASAPPPPAPLQ